MQSLENLYVSVSIPNLFQPFYSLFYRVKNKTFRTFPFSWLVTDLWGSRWRKLSLELWGRLEVYLCRDQAEQPSSFLMLRVQQSWKTMSTRQVCYYTNITITDYYSWLRTLYQPEKIRGIESFIKGSFHWLFESKWRAEPFLHSHHC